jgi:hypothetical protein
MPDIRADLGMSHLAGVLVISLFIAGYCIGPLVWGESSTFYLLGEAHGSIAPMSETVSFVLDPFYND